MMPLGHAARATGFDLTQRDRLDAGAKRFGEISAVDEPERDDRRHERIELEAGMKQRADQQRQHEMHPNHHDVVGRIPENLDVQGADPAQRSARRLTRSNAAPSPT